MIGVYGALLVAMHESVLSLGVCENRDGWLVAWGFVGEWLFDFPLCGFSLSLICNYTRAGPP